MELVKRFKAKRKEERLRETRFGTISFIFALLTLAYFNILLMTEEGLEGGLNKVFLILPVISVISALLSFTRVNYKKTFSWWGLFLIFFMLICIFVIGFFGFTINPKP